jgi:ribonuclease P protein component
VGAVRSLKRSEDFRRVRETGATARRNGVTVFVAPATPGHPGGRAGITVPGRVGGAVVRNRLRRRLRAALQRSDLGRDRDVVVRVDPSAAGANYLELETSLRNALSRANEGLRR